ncbi:apolipoprotein N-acyltransferase [Thiohalorhabdus denitrificans]|uniref:Apolipoprotein N-acyltransferase n=1 Tax=Thiohalorhabdus denitrificans TaxID=381306 RepID=A0A1G5ELS7_9GAMM|nr:apolipoprotein N-acyltransferase [Thiohalorhabdus denitrificans]SCY27620.1 apolipoprotein N-acyltransferase [Thiohalorhabdus denitrificans]
MAEDPPVTGRARTLAVDLAYLAAGMLAPLAFAPWDWYALAWVLLIPLFLATEIPASGVRFRRGLAFGLGMFGAGLHWLLPTIHTFGHMPLALAVPTWALLVAYCALYPALFALAGGWLGGGWLGGPRPWRMALGLPLLWVALEGLRGLAFTGFPWLTLGVTQTQGPLAGLFPVVGSLGAGLAVACVNGALLLAYLARDRGILLPLAWLGGAAAVVGAGLLAATPTWTSPSGSPLRAALVQGAVPQEMKWSAERRAAILERYRRLTLANLDADLVVWPETAVPLFADRVGDYLDALERTVAARGGTLLLGVPERDWEDGERRNYNAAMALGAGDQQPYRKRHLVPFGEYVPLPSLLFFAERFVPGEGVFAAGESAAPLEVDGHRAGMSICYEDAFPREVAATVREGADLLVNVTNDAWFGGSIGPDQHAQLARVRAMEMGRPLLRVANTGITYAADHRGRVLERIPRDEPGVARATVQPRIGATPYQWLSRGWLLGGVLAGLGLFVLLARRRGRLV